MTQEYPIRTHKEITDKRITAILTGDEEEKEKVKKFFGFNPSMRKGNAGKGKTCMLITEKELLELKKAGFKVTGDRRFNYQY